MLIDAHCHLYDLKQYNNPEDELNNSNIIVVSSSTNIDEFTYNEKLAKNNNRIFLSIGIHPQMKPPLCAFASIRTGAFRHPKREEKEIEYLELLDNLAKEKRLAAIGECGFDLFNDEYKATEKWQDEIFSQHLEIAIKYDLPVILHVRRSLHKIFPYTNKLKKCSSVIFHSWPGTLEEGQALLRRGINAYFSFGNTILNGHKKQIRSCSLFPADRILTETDAPYQPAKGADFSSWKDLPKIIEKIALLRNSSALEMESQIEKNFNSSLRRPNL